MGEYKFKAEVNKERIYVVKRSKLDNRFDSVFYQEDIDYTKCIKLSKIAYVSGGKRLPKGYDYSPTPTKFRYLRIGNVSWGGELNYNDFKYLSEELFNILQRYEIKNKELLLAIVGATIGKCALLDTPYNDKVILTENCAKIELKNKTVIPEYLLIILKMQFIQKQIQLNFIQTTLPKLGLDRVLSLYIPKPPNLEIQQKIVDQYQKVYNQKQQKEKDAKDLLAGIDTYLLNELGITLPEMENTFKSRVFKVNFSEISGERFDAFAVLNKDYKIEGGKYENHRLRQIAEVQKGQSITSAKIIDGKYPVIAGGQSSPYSHNVFNYENNAITVSASGAYAGYVWYHSSPIFASDCSVIQSKDENNISTLFLSEVLKTKQKEIYNLQQGAGQPHVYSSDLVKLNIPVPPKEKQTEIINHISEIRAKSKQLEIEQIILSNQ
ncbi:MAG: type I restriction enzyme S subunit [Vicingaceae bacterium]|jgi:type I restriction enzyme S subunit